MILTTINEIFTLDRILVLVGFIVPLFIYLLLTKYRGIWASFFFLPVIYYGVMFALTIEQIAPYAEIEVVQYILSGFALLMQPFNLLIHELIMSLLGLIAPGVEIVKTILSASWFPLALYFLVWIIFMAIFRKKRRRKKQRRYEDDF